MTERNRQEVERQLQVVERETQVVERRCGPFQLHLISTLSVTVRGACDCLQWFDLDGVDKGRIKLRANWKQLNNDPRSLTQVTVCLSSNSP